MVKRSVEEWRALFKAHGHSGLTERKFCVERGLCQKYFNLRKKQLGWAQEAPKRMAPSAPPGTPAFVRIQKAPEQIRPEARVLLRLGRGVWEFRDVPAEWLAKVMVALG